jgi:hypothetical protein
MIFGKSAGFQTFIVLIGPDCVLILDLYATNAKSFGFWLYLSVWKRFTTILEIYFEKTEQNEIEFHGNIKRKYETENGPVLSNKPSLFEIQTVCCLLSK